MVDGSGIASLGRCGGSRCGVGFGTRGRGCDSAISAGEGLVADFGCDRNDDLEHPVSSGLETVTSKFREDLPA